MCRLLGGSEWETYRWHSWRRGGAFALAQSGAPSRVLMWFGGWVTPAIARAYCSPEEPIPFVASWSVPTFSDDGVWSRKRMSWKKLWPAVVVAQTLPSARIRPFPPTRPGEGEFGPGGAKGKRGTGGGEGEWGGDPGDRANLQLLGPPQQIFGEGGRDGGGAGGVGLGGGGNGRDRRSPPSGSLESGPSRAPASATAFLPQAWPKGGTGLWGRWG